MLISQSFHSSHSNSSLVRFIRSFSLRLARRRCTRASAIGRRWRRPHRRRKTPTRGDQWWNDGFMVIEYDWMGLSPRMMGLSMDNSWDFGYGSKLGYYPWPTDFWSCLVGKPSSYWGLIFLSHSQMMGLWWLDGFISQNEWWHGIVNDVNWEISYLVDPSRIWMNGCTYQFINSMAYDMNLPVCTAQGGSGSFKDRKLIGGWLLWMMDRRANEPMDRQAVGVSAVELRV